MGPGCAFIDYDGDGYPDILLVNGEDWPGHTKASSTLKLYHNNQNGTFTDVTAKAGLALKIILQMDPDNRHRKRLEKQGIKVVMTRA